MQIDTTDFRTPDITRKILNATSLTVKVGAEEYFGDAELSGEGNLVLSFAAKKGRKKKNG